MANQEHVELLMQGPALWNAWREEHLEIRIDLCWSDLNSTDLSGADLSGVDLSGADLSNANLRGADLRGADLGATYLRSFCPTNIYRRAASNVKETDLNRANSRLIYIRSPLLPSHDYRKFADLVAANLNGADLSNANLRGANLSLTDLSEANLSEADLLEVDLSRADLSNANLRGANLSNANLSNANLSGANLSGAKLDRTIFASVDLCTVEGLGTMVHQGPSRIVVNTVRLPGGETRVHFLRGVGFSDTFIDYLPSLLTAAIEYNSCFIGYAHQDEALAQRLYKDLQNKGVRCWYAPEEMKIGDRIRSRIDQAIYLQEKLLLLLSEHSLTSSWVEFEVESALEREQRQGGDVLFPVRLDDGVMHASQAWAATLRRTRHIGDFTNWMDPQVYLQAFERLLRDLKKANEPRGQEKKT